MFLTEQLQPFLTFFIDFVSLSMVINVHLKENMMLGGIEKA